MDCVLQGMDRLHGMGLQLPPGFAWDDAAGRVVASMVAEAPSAAGAFTGEAQTAGAEGSEASRSPESASASSAAAASSTPEPIDHAVYFGVITEEDDEDALAAALGSAPLAAATPVAYRGPAASLDVSDDEGDDIGSGTRSASPVRTQLSSFGAPVPLSPPSPSSRASTVSSAVTAHLHDEDEDPVMAALAQGFLPSSKRASIATASAAAACLTSPVSPSASTPSGTPVASSRSAWSPQSGGSSGASPDSALRMGTLDAVAVRSAVCSSRKSRIHAAGGYAALHSARKAPAASPHNPVASPAASAGASPSSPSYSSSLGMDLASALEEAAAAAVEATQPAMRDASAATGRLSVGSSSGGSSRGGSSSDPLSQLSAALDSVRGHSVDDAPSPGAGGDDGDDYDPGIVGDGQGGDGGGDYGHVRADEYDEGSREGAVAPAPSDGTDGSDSDVGEGDGGSGGDAVRGHVVVLRNIPAKPSTARALGVGTFLTPVRRSLRVFRNELAYALTSAGVDVVGATGGTLPASVVAAVHPAGGASTCTGAGPAGAGVGYARAGKKKCVSFASDIQRSPARSRDTAVQQAAAALLAAHGLRQATPYHTRRPAQPLQQWAGGAEDSVVGPGESQAASASKRPQFHVAIEAPATPAGGSPGAPWAAGLAAAEEAAPQPSGAAGPRSPLLTLGCEDESVASGSPSSVAFASPVDGAGPAGGSPGSAACGRASSSSGGVRASTMAKHQRMPLGTISDPGRRNALPLHIAHPHGDATLAHALANENEPAQPADGPVQLQWQPTSGSGGDEPEEGHLLSDPLNTWASARGQVRHHHLPALRPLRASPGAAGGARLSQGLFAHYSPVVAHPGPFMGRILSQNGPQRVPVDADPAPVVTTVHVPHSAIQRAMIPGDSLADTEDGLSWAPNPALPGVTMRAGHLHADGHALPTHLRV